MAYRSKSQRLKAVAKSWTAFSEILITDEMKRDHEHLRTCKSMFANSRYQAEVFECASAIGGVIQLVVRRHLAGIDPISWDDLQRCKNDLYGPNAVAVEVYPAQNEQWRINREVRVLWILPQNYSLPVGLHLESSWGR